ncbi:HAT family dimerization protein [Ceratobasidium theobromae]|uniref:HAT family dimerization protein n=1 Tax=Ceratobasidium theobromae TaxID=1582974 RepID=A0A5N5QGX7_9AGAM|nr:HAT family dimerization protein [Ceratobasidium theobromae]
MGRIHTKYRSHLELQRIRDTVVLKNALIEEFVDERSQNTSLKCKVRDFDSEQSQDKTFVHIGLPEGGQTVAMNTDKLKLQTFGIEDQYEGEEETDAYGTMGDNHAGCFTRPTRR